MESNESFIPYVGVIKEMFDETPDVKSFRVVGLDGKKLFEHKPGQCAMLIVPGVGESMISITSSPTVQEYMQFSIKKCGCVTTWLHNAQPGQQIAIRGPIGNGFPVDTTFKGKDILVIAGGIGLAPVHSVVDYMLAHRSDYGRIQVIYGSRSKQDLVFLKQLQEEWAHAPNLDLNLTIDRAQDDWDGHVGFVPPYVTEMNPDPSMTVIMCGPPILIHLSLDALKKLGFKDENVFTTLEMRMKCGIGKCGRCNVGNKFVCKDGPVFSFTQLAELPGEY
ncbi:MAG: FAD/NAD(P)-binding protein [Treponema sp.]|jgi:NAD(P)H-flavin reductase|nr:FAD/NAD(P)-binding protein [Treponema sp.]MBP5697153.1 FAD/NAD(P)-binding protein [Treponema sp.]MBQ1590691.1 FAD/NAD(P)-binding protein [Treponema sp.]MBQ1642952.1 FAD/NAD(P)-binding protein [Treponema sp.]MBQ1670205.1 FAD/NAD(P)-binding protein [Treponema sp.]